MARELESRDFSSLKKGHLLTKRKSSTSLQTIWGYTSAVQTWRTAP